MPTGAGQRAALAAHVYKTSVTNIAIVDIRAVQIDPKVSKNTGLKWYHASKTLGEDPPQAGAGRKVSSVRPECHGRVL